MTSLSFKELVLCHPFYYGKIIAGWEAAERCFHNISFHAEESLPNTLLLVKSNENHLCVLEIALSNPQIVGIIFYGLDTVYLPSILETHAKKQKKPFFFLRNPDGERLKQRIDELLLLKKQNLFHFATKQMTNYWLDLLNRKDIKEVLKRLNLFMETEVLFFNTQKILQIIYPTLYSQKDFQVLKVIRNHDETLPEGFSLVTNQEKNFYLFQMLSPNKKIIGYFLFEKKSTSLSVFEISLLDAIVPTIVTWVKQTVITKSIHLKYKDQFLYDILNNNIDSEQEMIEMAKLWDMDFLPNPQVFAINLGDSIPITKDVIIRLQELFQADHIPFKIYTTHLSHRIVGIVFPTTNMEQVERKKLLNDWMDRIQKKIQKIFPGLQTTIGIGRVHPSNLEIHQSFQEAKISLQMYDYVPMTKGFIHYDEIGYVRLLSYIHDDLLSDFSMQYLQELIVHDQKNETDLIDTLYSYCNHNGDVIESAQNLFIHPNTLRQRLKKIEAILQMDLNNYTNIVNLMLALKIEKTMNI